jgi:hypothetical protein
MRSGSRQMLDGEQAPLQFIVTVGLGRLARWLRLLGYDTLYLRGDAKSVAYRARAEGRILLTLDHTLTRQRDLRVVVVDSTSLEEQLIQVIEGVNLRLPGNAPRCMGCNEILEELTPAEALHYVPSHIARTQKRFQRCPACNKVYWPGTRYKGLQIRLRQVSEGRDRG